MTRWEYLQLRWIHETNFTSKEPDEPQTWKDRYGVRGPDGSQKELTVDDGNSFWAYFNELGGEGWELVSETVEETTVARNRGWSNVGMPIQTTWTFKRPVT